MSADTGAVTVDWGQRLRTLAWLVPALVGTVLGAAYLTPPVYELVTSQGWFEPAPTDPDRLFLKVFRRLLLIPLLVIIALWLKPWRDARAAAVGLRGQNARWQTGLLSFGVTWGVGAGILAWHLTEGWIVFEDPLRWGKAIGRLLKYTALGISVGVCEEWFFRGWLWRHIGRGRRTILAALLCSVIYGLAHAFRPGALEHEVTLDAAGALDALAGWGAHALDMTAFGPRFFGLFLLGLLLCALYRHRGNLWASVGVHAGGISLIYGYGGFTDRTSRPDWAGSKVLYDAWPVWVLLVLVTLLLVRTRRDSEGLKAPETSSG